MTRYATFHDLDGQSVFITGGGSGIGAALTEGFLEQGAQRRLRPALRRDRLRRGDGGEARDERRFSSPATSPTSPRCRRAMATAAEAHGPITVLVNNAANDAAPPDRGLHRRGRGTAPQAVNLRPHFFTAQAALPGHAGGGRRRDRQLLVDLLHDGQRRLSRLRRRQGRHHRPDPRPRPRPRPRQHPRQRADARLGADLAAARQVGDAGGAGRAISPAPVPQGAPGRARHRRRHAVPRLQGLAHDDRPGAGRGRRAWW